MKLINLAKEYDYNYEHEVVLYMYHSFLNGNRMQTKQLYNEIMSCVDYHLFPEIIVEHLTQNELNNLLDYINVSDDKIRHWINLHYNK